MTMEGQQLRLLSFPDVYTISQWRNLCDGVAANIVGDASWWSVASAKDVKMWAANPGGGIAMLFVNQLDTDTGFNEMEMFGRLIADSVTLLGAKLSPMNKPAASKAFTGGDIRILIDILNNIREQYKLV